VIKFSEELKANTRLNSIDYQNGKPLLINNAGVPSKRPLWVRIIRSEKEEDVQASKLFSFLRLFKDHR
jgi:hypothetical protein